MKKASSRLAGTDGHTFSFLELLSGQKIIFYVVYGFSLKISRMK